MIFSGDVAIAEGDKFQFIGISSELYAKPWCFNFEGAFLTSVALPPAWGVYNALSGLESLKDFNLAPPFIANNHIQDIPDGIAVTVSKFTLHGELTQKGPAEIQKYNGRVKFLYLTRYYSHKNIEVLVDMFFAHPEDLSDIILFITIEKEDNVAAGKLLDSIASKGLSDKIINLGAVPQENLVDIFMNVDGLLMPTLLESFSGSYLEAMHFKIPILTSELDFAKEVCQDAALYFDPWDCNSIKDTIVHFRDNPEIALRLAKNGGQRISNMNQTWRDVAGNILQEFDDLQH